MRRSPIRSTMAGPSCSSGRSARDGGPARRRGRPGLAAALRAAGPRRRRARPRAPPAGPPRCRATRWRWPGSGCRRCARRDGPRPRTLRRRAGAGAVRRASAAHSMLRLDRPLSASFGLVLATLRPCGRLADGPRRGRRTWRRALAAELEALGGEVVTGHRGGRRSRSCRRRARVLFDLTPAPAPCDRRRPAVRRAPAARRAVPLRPGRVQGRLGARRPDPVAADGPRGAGTVHLGGTLEEIAAPRRRSPRGAASRAARSCSLAQHEPCDPTRRPPASTTAWAYCHVPERLDRRHDRADRGAGRALRPGLPRPDPRRARRRAGRRSRRYNANYVGGDINGGIEDLRQLVIRPWPAARHPYRDRRPALFLCSSSTPPGGGVHGMCGSRRPVGAPPRPALGTPPTGPV